MLLDIYYKLHWWFTRCAAEMEDVLTIPLTYFADGNTHNKITWVYSSTAYTQMANVLLSKPYPGMFSQAADPQLGQVGSATYAHHTNFVVGSGATPVTASDYRLEQEIVEGLACDAVTSQVDDTTHTVTYRKTLRNTSDDDITIREVGLTGAVTTTMPTRKQVLVYREVLETPVTIAPGDSATLRITIRHEMPV